MAVTQSTTPSHAKAKNAADRISIRVQLTPSELSELNSGFCDQQGVICQAVSDLLFYQARSRPADTPLKPMAGRENTTSFSVGFQAYQVLELDALARKSGIARESLIQIAVHRFLKLREVLDPLLGAVAGVTDSFVNACSVLDVDVMAALASDIRSDIARWEASLDRARAAR
jgi:hypothetical protein